jgi:hypothetical protein
MGKNLTTFKYGKITQVNNDEIRVICKKQVTKL